MFLYYRKITDTHLSGQFRAINQTSTQFKLPVFSSTLYFYIDAALRRTFLIKHDVIKIEHICCRKIAGTHLLGRLHDDKPIIEATKWGSM